MAQLSNDCFAFGDGPLRLDQVVQLIAERLDCAVGSETVPLMRADGRVLTHAVVAPRDLPGFDNSAVDGYAVRHADLATGTETVLEVAGRGPAGRSAGMIPRLAAYRIFTGAPIPDDLDTVFMQEDVRIDKGGRAILPPGLPRGANLRRAGEDIACGQPALPAGRRLAPADLALLGALGLGAVEVRHPLRVALFSTGDEIADGTARGPGQLHDANRPMLAASLARLGAEVTDGGILPDRPDAVAAALRDAARGHDLVMTSGGVSAGEEDHVRNAVAASGSLTFWRIGIKPGRPVAMGIVAGTPFIGLPGNPVAAFVTFAFVARPLIARLAGEVYAPPVGFAVRSEFAHAKRKDRREFLRVRIAHDPDGVATVAKHPREGAGIITSLTESDGFVVLDDDVTEVRPGDRVTFLSFAALI